MQKSGYDTRLSAGAITAGGTLGILIPPSIMLIVLGPILRVSLWHAIVPVGRRLVSVRDAKQALRTACTYGDAPVETRVRYVNTARLAYLSQIGRH